MHLGTSLPEVRPIMSWILQYCWILPFCMGTIIKIVETEQTATFIWNKSNALFRGEHGASLTIAIGSNLVLKCPYNPNNATLDEYYKLYWLPEVAFRDCFKPNDNTAQLFVNCNKPNITIEFTQEITTFSGVPGAKDFKVGQSYYISTLSTGTVNGLNNEDKGACKDYNMKLNITITDQVLPSTKAPIDPLIVTTKSIVPGTPLPAASTTATTTTVATTTISSTTGSTATTISKKTVPMVITTTTQKPSSSVIPLPTDTINVPDNGNSAVIDVTSGAQTPCMPAIIVPLCLSILHILYLHIPHTLFHIQR